MLEAQNDEGLTDNMVDENPALREINKRLTMVTRVLIANCLFGVGWWSGKVVDKGTRATRDVLHTAKFANDTDVDPAIGQSVSASLWSLMKDDPFFTELGAMRDEAQTLGQLSAFRSNSDLLGCVEDVQVGYELHGRALVRMNSLAGSLTTAAKQFSQQAAAIKKARKLEAKVGPSLY